jgi:iron complex outermembrane receptor protein
MNSKLSYAIASILSGNAAGLTHAAAATDASSDAIQEIIVTAQRRAENMQDVPIAMQALTAETLAQLNVPTLDEFVKYLPNVTVASFGPGQNNVYMRGLSVGGQYAQGSGGVGSFPNVSIYLDEQSAQIPGRNLDIYAADIDRIEVLEGPQGTLFGSGAEAGVLRFITNKPKLDVTEARVDAGYGYTTHGDNNSDVEAVINLPLVADTAAVRAVIYNDSRGGYINSVPGVLTRHNTDPSIHYANYPAGCGPNSTPPGPPCQVPPGSPVVNNSNSVANAINPVTYQGIRVQALYKINDSWNVLLSQSYQNINSQGVFYDTPNGSDGEPLPPLSVQLFNPSYNKDKFENTTLTINGHIGDLKLVYSGSYLVHNVDQVQDYTNYARGVFADYYQCIPGKATAPAMCYSPSATWREIMNDSHNSQELRLSTPDDWRWRAIGGVFWEEYTVNETIDFYYKTAPGFAPLIPPPGSTANNPNVRPYNDSFFDDITRGYRQTAAFGSIDYDIIPKRLTATVGTRYYRITNSESGSEVSSFGCYVGVTTTTPCSNYSSGINLNDEDLHTTYSGFKSRANLSWRVTDDILLYYTWSQGFRPGGFNRSSSDHPLPGGFIFTTPLSFAPDSLTNNELGWKTEWFDHRLQFNGAVYQEDWKNVQVSFFDPQGGLGNLTFITNGPNYRIRGVEPQVVALVTHGLTITGAASWNSSNQTNSPFLIDTKGSMAGQPITSIPNPYGPLNSPTSQSPPFQANLRVRYEFAISDYKAFCQIGGQHQAHSYSATGNVQAYDQPGFSTYDASAGVAKDAWTVQVIGQNVTDTRAALFINSNEWINAVTVNRPRTVTLRFSYKF